VNTASIALKMEVNVEYANRFHQFFSERKSIIKFINSALSLINERI
jgi:hypothetical protein